MFSASYFGKRYFAQHYFGNGATGTDNYLVNLNLTVAGEVSIKNGIAQLIYGIASNISAETAKLTEKNIAVEIPAAIESIQRKISWYRNAGIDFAAQISTPRNVIQGLTAGMKAAASFLRAKAMKMQIGIELLTGFGKATDVRRALGVQLEKSEQKAIALYRNTKVEFSVLFGTALGVALDVTVSLLHHVYKAATWTTATAISVVNGFARRIHPPREWEAETGNSESWIEKAKQTLKSWTPRSGKGSDWK
jgi:hypothetical protein